MVIKGIFLFLKGGLKSANFVDRLFTILISRSYGARRDDTSGNEPGGKKDSGIFVSAFIHSRLINLFRTNPVECGAIALFLMPENKTS